MNISLLCKWWWRLENETCLWQDIIYAKYMKKAVIASVSHKIHDSPVWADLLKIKNLYLRGRRIDIKNGEGSLF
jgi:hypothetical protein